MVITKIKKSTAEYNGKKIADVFASIEDEIAAVREREELEFYINCTVNNDVADLSLEDLDAAENGLYQCRFKFRNGVLIQEMTKESTTTDVFLESDWVCDSTPRDAAMMLLRLAGVYNTESAGSEF